MKQFERCLLWLRLSILAFNEIALDALTSKSDRAGKNGRRLAFSVCKFHREKFCAFFHDIDTQSELNKCSQILLSIDWKKQEYKIERKGGEGLKVRNSNFIANLSKTISAIITCAFVLFSFPPRYSLRFQLQDIIITDSRDINCFYLSRSTANK